MNAQPQPFALPDLPGLLYLRGRNQWVAWKFVWKDGPDKKPTKVPLQPGAADRNASVNDPSTWGAYEAARQLVGAAANGVGYVLTEDDEITGIDLDNCRNAETGHIDPWALDILNLSETYAEVSPSGKGIRLFARGKPAKATKRGGIEIYGTGRFLTVTGNHLADETPDSIKLAPRTLEALRARVAAMTPPKPEPSPAAAHDSGSGAHCGDTSMAEIAELLFAIDPDVEEPEWRDAMAAVHNEARGSSEGFRLVDDWSSRGSKYKSSKDVEGYWRRFKVGGGIGIGTLAKMARDHGADLGEISHRHNRPGGYDPVEAAEAVRILGEEVFGKREQAGSTSHETGGEQTGEAGGKGDQAGAGDAGSTNQRRSKLKHLGDPDLQYVVPDELVRDTISSTGVGFLGGQSGAYKTFTAIELAFCVMTGHPFADRIIERTGPVLYIPFEGAGTIQGRVVARRTTLDDKRARLPFYTMDDFGSVSTNARMAAFAHEIMEIAAEINAQEREPLRLIIVDTVSASGMIGEDKEDDPAAWQRVFDFFNPCSKALNAAVLLVHHYGKNASAGLRGSSNARAAAEFVVAVTCDRDEVTGETRNRAMALTKTRTGIEGPICAVSATPVEIGKRSDGTVVTSLVLKFDTGVKLTNNTLKVSRAVQCFRDAYRAAIAEHSETVNVDGSAIGSLVKAVRIKHVREAFDRIYVTGSDDPQKRAETLRKQFANGLKGKPEIIIARSWGGEEWLWDMIVRREGE